MEALFITSTGTDVGKTLVTTALCWQLRQQGKKITALKPVASGFDPKDDNSDPALILKSCGLNPTPLMIDSISPWRFAAPMAPSMAAAKEGRVLDLELVKKFCLDHADLQSDVVIVEGAGGVMAPLTETRTMLDLMAALNWGTVLVAGNYLGSLSHTLTAVETLRGRKIPIRALVVCESANSHVPLTESASALEKFMPVDIPVVKIPRMAVKSDMWKFVPPISWIAQ